MARLWKILNPEISHNWVQSPDGTMDKLTLQIVFQEYFRCTIIMIIPMPELIMIGIPVANLHMSEGLTSWSFLIRYGYDPSSSNNWALFLMSDSEPAEMSPDDSDQWICHWSKPYGI